MRLSPLTTLAYPLLEMLALAERRSKGKGLRDKVGRADNARWSSKKRASDPIATLLGANVGRLPNLLPLKWGRMSISPFAFFRGAAPLMAGDLATLPVTGLRVQLCGDAHVRNLGAYAAPEGHLVFDINDFDETIPGPWEWDLKRLASSLILAGSEAADGKSACRAAALEMVRSYRTAISRFAKMKVLDLTRVEIRRGSGGALVQAVFRKAARVTPAKILQRLTVVNKRERHRFHDEPPVLRHVNGPVRGAVFKALTSYRQTLAPGRQLIFDAYDPMDVAFKVVGTGSIGTRDYVVLLFGNGTNDPLILQVKEEMPSCYAPYLLDLPAFKHEGQRVAEGQERMQTVSDPFLGWTTIEGRQFLVRQLSDHKAAINPLELKGASLCEYGVVCGELLAKGHACTGDAAAIAGYCGNSTKLDNAMAKFAQLYADQTHRDYDLFKKAIAKGRVRSSH